MLSENIKAIRKSKGLSQQELAVKVNVVRQTVSKWEQGLSVPDNRRRMRSKPSRKNWRLSICSWPRERS